MKDFFNFILASIINGVMIYIIELIMNTLLKIFTGKNQEEPSMLYAVIVGFIVHAIYFLIK